MPKEFFALNESSSSFLRANFFMVTLSSNNFNLSEGISSKLAGELKRVKISREVLPKTSEKTDSYSGNSNNKRINLVCFMWTDSGRIAPRICLNGVYYVNNEMIFHEERVQSEPVVPCRLHADFQF